MRLHIRVFKERREPGNGRPLRSIPKPLSEDLAGERFIGRFSVDGNGKSEQEASGRDMEELAVNIRIAVLRSEPGLKQEGMPGFSFRFAKKPDEKKRTLVGSEGSYDILVRRLPLLGEEITGFFRAIESVFRPEMAE
jgi:hypothetical protein